MTYAIAADVEVEIGRPAISPAETAQIEVWLARVERQIARRFAAEGYDLDTQVDLGQPTLADVVDAEVAAVARKVENPNGITSVTRSVDDAQVTTRREGVIKPGDPLLLTDDEWSTLLPVKTDRSRVFSVMPS